MVSYLQLNVEILFKLDFGPFGHFGLNYMHWIS